MATPTPKREAVQAAVLEATEALLAEGASFADLGIERIATRAGISRTAFYFYFRDKRELLIRLAEAVTEVLYAEADVWFTGTGDDREQMRAALRKIGGLYDEHGPLLRAIVEVSTYDEEVATFWRGLLGRFVDASRARLEREGHGEGAHARAFALVWMTERSFYQHLVQEPAFSRDDLVEAFVDVWQASAYRS